MPLRFTVTRIPNSVLTLLEYITKAMLWIASSIARSLWLIMISAGGSPYLYSK